ncbi:MAG: DUF3597 domain-containing protein [Verrucomicrobiales bacterium]|nr:DUF3597 domain-containing protein [Verrucomicrobiales bacterium]
MEIFSGLIDGIFGDESESASKGKKKKFGVKNTKGLNPDIAAKKAAKEAYAAAQRAAAAQAAANSIDVGKVLDKKARSVSKKKLEWRTSIVDLMQVCEMDSSFAARKKLAAELGYTGSSHAATMNRWLHKEMMRQIVANGGKVSRKVITQ